MNHVSPQSITIAALASARRWVAWRTELRGGRATKVPIRPSDGLPARTTVPADWVSRAEAERRVAMLPDGSGPKGIGVVLGVWPEHDALRLGGVDLDRCRDPATGSLADWAREVIEMLDTYAEVSPSGTGVKAFFRLAPDAIDALRDAGLLPAEAHGRSFKLPGEGDHPPAIEAHLGGRYYAVTDGRLPDAPAELREVPTVTLATLLREIGPRFAGNRAAARDESRSAVAFRIARQVKARGGGYEDFVAACEADPEAGAWLREKGFANGGREARRAWDRSSPAAAPTDWPAPDLTLLSPLRAPPPALPLDEVFHPAWRTWIRSAAEAKGSPPDYVAAALLSVAGALIGNARWAAPHEGWAEPPAVWAMLIGRPSAGKSPALDACTEPLRALERRLHGEVEAAVQEWQQRAEIAEAAKDAWKAAAKAALKAGKEPPPRPQAADPGSEPHLVRLVLQDATTERLACLAAKQNKGLLLIRDELAGLLANLTRYTGGGSDRPFFLEGFGGRPYVVERVGRPPSRVGRLLVTLAGGIQPDRLASLLLDAEDDGLLARFLPIWPEPAPLRRDPGHPDGGFVAQAFERLWGLRLEPAADGERPWFVPFSEGAREVLFEVRTHARALESDAHGLMVSYIGKAPGSVVRLALVLAYLDWSAEGGSEPRRIEAEHVGRAAHYVFEYAVPMARRAYAEAAAPTEETAARRLARLIRDERLEAFTIREVQRRELAGLRRAVEIETAADVLVQAGLIRPLRHEPGPRGGRPQIVWTVSPHVTGGGR